MVALMFAVCTFMPDFSSTVDTPVCMVANQATECRCSECMEWDGVDQSLPNAPTWYDVERTNPDGSFVVVGGTWQENWVDEEGVSMSAPPKTVWCFAKDVPIPQEGQLYGYRVRACKAGACSQYFEQVEYMAAPYAINLFQPPVVGN